jgi:hypothetical protein
MTLPHDDFERRLADVLLVEAETVIPAGDGLVKIRQRIERRRGRARWLRPALAVTTAAALGATAFVAFNVQDGTDMLRGDRDQPAGRPSAAGSGIPTSAPATFALRTPLWPFTTGEEAAGWREGGGAIKQPWLLSPVKTATSFASFLGVHDLEVLSTKNETQGVAVTLGRAGSIRPTAVTVVHVSRVGNGAGAPWVVRLAGAYGMHITAPKYETRVTSPVRVLTDATSDVTVQVWSAHSPTPHGEAVLRGNRQGAAAGEVPFAGTSGGLGMLVARQQTQGGAIAKLTAIPVVLPGDSAAPPSYPTSFVGVVAGRIATVDSTTGARLRWLTARQPGGGDREPVLAGDTVFYVHGTGTCSAEIWRVPVGGGRASRVVGGRSGAAAQVAVSAGGRMLAWVQSNCAGGGALHTLDLRTGKTREFAMDAPPTVEGKPAWAPDDRHLAFRYGHSAGGARGYPVLLLDTATARSLHDAKPVTSSAACDQGRPAYTARGSLLLVTCQGSSAAVVRLRDGTTTTLFSVPGGAGRVTDVITALDVSSTNVVIFETRDSSGAPRIMRWTGGSPVTIDTTASSPAW